MKFSQRIGITPVKTMLQIGVIDSDLRNSIWNLAFESFFSSRAGIVAFSSHSGRLAKLIWTEHLGLRADEIPVIDSYSSPQIDFNQFTLFVKKIILSDPWEQVYDLVEFFCSHEIRSISNLFAQQCNSVLAKHISGYRVIDGAIVQISSSEEINEIEVGLSYKDKYLPVSTHLSKAIKFLADRETPDFQNSIKESISAVESFCFIVNGQKSPSFADALRPISKRIKLHPALQNAYNSLFGYTSNAGGIRHGLLGNEEPVGLDEAKFMLVNCSSFINFMKVKVDGSDN